MRMLRPAATLCMGFMLLGLSLPVGAAEGRGGTSAADFLRLGSGALAPTVGDAMTAGANGTLSMHYNPAGLGFADRGEIAASYQNIVTEADLGDLAVSHHFGENGGIGASVRLLSYGSAPRTTIATAGAVVTSTRNGTFSSHDIAGAIGYGRRFGD